MPELLPTQPDSEMKLSAPRCQFCCFHGVELTWWCGWCEDISEGYYDCLLAPDEPMWKCSHGVGKDV